MPVALSAGLAAEIDAFLAEPKRLDGPEPTWIRGSRPSEMSAEWLIVDDLGISKAKLRFRCPISSRLFPSVSLIYRSNPIWRIDLVRSHEKKPNPLPAQRLGLPPVVVGSHAHTWPDNRPHLMSQHVWELPYRRPLDGPVRRLPQALFSLADAISLTIVAHQRGFDVPRSEDLFEER